MATPTPTLPSRIRGAFYGLAVTDALGGPVEFHPRHTFPPVTSYLPNHNFNLPPGAWTDDTSMTLCLGSSLVSKGATFDLKDQVQRYTRWYERGEMSSTGVCFDIGNATREALGIWRVVFGRYAGESEERWGVDLEEGLREVERMLGREECCGNGSLMRCLPIPLVFYAEPALAAEYAARQSSVTHPHLMCREACRVYTALVGAILRGGEKGVVDKTAVFGWFKACRVEGEGTLKEMIGKYQESGDWGNVPAREIESSGFVVHTLEAALWAFFTTGTFREGALKVVNLGDDADTVGAVYGGLAGAFYGIEGVPEEWIEGLYAKLMVDEVVEGVVRLVEERREERRQVEEVMATAGEK